MAQNVAPVAPNRAPMAHDIALVAPPPSRTDQKWAFCVGILKFTIFFNRFYCGFVI